jgi:hypothetical protein
MPEVTLFNRSQYKMLATECGGAYRYRNSRLLSSLASVCIRHLQITHQAIDVYMLSRTGYSQVIFKFLLGVKMQPENRSINLESDLIVTWETRDIQVFNYY